MSWPGWLPASRSTQAQAELSAIARRIEAGVSLL